MVRPPKNSLTLAGADDDDVDHRILPKPKKLPGRPKGSKNKPKPPLLTNDQSPAVDVIDIPAGADVVEWLSQYSRSRQKSITVLSASGMVSNIAIRHLLNFAESATSIPGPIPILFLSGSITQSSPSSCLSPLVIYLPGWNGQIIYGFVGGSVTATSTVKIVVMTASTEYKANISSTENSENNSENSSGNRKEFDIRLAEYELDNNPSANDPSHVDNVVHPALALAAGSALGDLMNFKN